MVVADVSVLLEDASMDFIIEFILGVAFFFVLIRMVKHMKNRK